MDVQATTLDQVLLLKPTVYSDQRGFFYESFNLKKFKASTDLQPEFVQDNHSASVQGVLRGLHYQLKQPQGKLIRVISGEIYDVAVNIDPASPQFGQWTGHHLSAENKLQMWVPAGFAHGFLVLSDYAEVAYKTTDYYAPDDEYSIKWDDPDLNIQWPLEVLKNEPILSAKDSLASTFANATRLVTGKKG